MTVLPFDNVGASRQVSDIAVQTLVFEGLAPTYRLNLVTIPLLGPLTTGFSIFPGYDLRKSLTER